MTEPLAVRDLLDSRLAEILAAPGCPVCLYRNRSARRFIAAVLNESVNDRGFRRDLDKARGFCAAHTHDVLRGDRRESGGSVAAAILFGAVATVRGRELDDAAGQRGRARMSRLEAARGAPACPVCAEAQSAEGHAIARLLDRSSDEGWADALAIADICLDHLLALGAAASATNAAPWLTVEERQRARIADLRERLRLFAHHSSHDRRHLITDEERRSADEAARLLGGTPPED